MKAWVAESNQRIKTHEETIAKWSSIMPYEQMTQEDFFDAHPDLAIDTVNRPTLWPHYPHLQPGYVEPEERIEAGEKK